MTVKEAYWEVAGKQLHTDRNKMREELLKETSEAALRAPTVPRSHGETPRKQGPLSTREIVARTLAEQEKV